MIRPNRFTIVLVISAICAIAVMAFVLTGRGGDANVVSGSAIAQAAGATASAPGAVVSMHIKMTISGVAQPIEAQLQGVEDTRDKSARLTGAYTHLPKKVPGQRPDGSVPIDSVAIGVQLYMKSPLFAAQLPQGKQWLHIDLAKEGQQLGIGDPTQFQQGDPMQALKTLRAIGGRVERIGTERVRGVETTRYRTTIELRRLPDTVAPSKRAAAKKGIDRLIQLTGSDSYPVEVWVDAHHLVRRMVLTQKSKLQTGRSMTLLMTFEIFDFGRKPKVQPPPADSVYDATKVAGRSGG